MDNLTLHCPSLFQGYFIKQTGNTALRARFAKWWSSDAYNCVIFIQVAIRLHKSHDCLSFMADYLRCRLSVPLHHASLCYVCMNYSHCLQVTNYSGVSFFHFFRLLSFMFSDLFRVLQHYHLRWKWKLLITITPAQTPSLFQPGKSIICGRKSCDKVPDARASAVIRDSTASICYLKNLRKCIKCISHTERLITKVENLKSFRTPTRI